MKNHVLCAFVGFTLVMPSLAAQTNGTTQPPIPEEARKHFVMGTTLLNDAKSADDFAQVEKEFKQATDLAPQWPDARYKLALVKEAESNYSGAMADLKLCQQLKLTDAEARKVQDQIYVVEAKQQKAVDAANSPAAQLEKLTQSLDGGVWRCEHSLAYQSNNGSQGSQWVDQDAGHTYIWVSGHTISGYTEQQGVVENGVANGTLVRDIAYNPNATPNWTATLTGRKFNFTSSSSASSGDTGILSQTDEATISDDGQSITETVVTTAAWGTVTRTRTFARIK